ncbi:hypothetical protein F5Y16DRAFT_405579 [Xylariaceae sp. FL0255]|nr:hypothetical protein F5Y16DRAFT_405579 [Xylariaceae sp. FL0255]
MDANTYDQYWRETLHEELSQVGNNTIATIDPALLQRNSVNYALALDEQQWAPLGVQSPRLAHPYHEAQSSLLVALHAGLPLPQSHDPDLSPTPMLMAHPIEPICMEPWSQPLSIPYPQPIAFPTTNAYPQHHDNSSNEEQTSLLHKEATSAPKPEYEVQHAIVSKDPYTCRCGGLFASKFTITRHIAKFDSDSIPEFPCPECDAHQGNSAFKRRDHLMQHLRVSHGHDGTANFKDRPQPICYFKGCDYSRPLSFMRLSKEEQYENRPFEKPSDQIPHMREEHDWSPFGCDVSACDRVNGKGFFTADALYKHLVKKHAISAMELIRCKFCGEEFKVSSMALHQVRNCMGRANFGRNGYRTSRAITLHEDINHRWSDETEGAGDGVVCTGLTFSCWTNDYADREVRAPINVICPDLAPCDGLVTKNLVIATDEGKYIMCAKVSRIAADASVVVWIILALLIRLLLLLLHRE